MVEKKEGKKQANPGRIVASRHYDAVSGKVLISMERIIDCFYEYAKKDYYHYQNPKCPPDHISLVMGEVRDFLAELKHCDEPPDPYVEENEAEAESSVNIK